MKATIQTADAYITTNGEIRSIRAAVASRDKREHVAGLLAHERQLREEIAHAGELMAHDAMRDQRDFAAMPAEGE
jgi:hypothetical protein